MKRTAYILMSLCLAAFCSGCTDDVKYEDPQVYPVKGLYYPETDYYLELQSGAGKVQTFRWAAAGAQDGDPVQYEIVFFDRQTGGNEVGRVDAGFGTSVSVSHKEINRAAGRAGITSGEEGAVYWTVASGRGANTVVSTAARNSISVKRLLGFDVLPETLYLTGSATETGDDVSKARKFRYVSNVAAGDEGEFEIFTRLGAGTFNMVTGTGGEFRTFSYSNGILEESADGAQIPGEGVYRIYADFSIRSITFTKVETVRYVFMHDESWNRELIYQGGGIWKADDFEVHVDRTVGWGVEQRYRINATMSDGNYVWGPTDFSLDGSPSDTDYTSDYYAIRIWPNTDFWNPKWKWHSSLYDKTGVALFADMSGEAKNYYHYLK